MLISTLPVDALERKIAEEAFHNQGKMPNNFGTTIPVRKNDKAVMEAYGFAWRTMSESDCVAELFKMYQKLTN